MSEGKELHAMDVQQAAMPSILIEVIGKNWSSSRLIFKTSPARNYPQKMSDKSDESDQSDKSDGIRVPLRMVSRVEVEMDAETAARMRDKINGRILAQLEADLYLYLPEEDRAAAARAAIKMHLAYTRHASRDAAYESVRARFFPNLPPKAQDAGAGQPD